MSKQTEPAVPVHLPAEESDGCHVEPPRQPSGTTLGARAAVLAGLIVAGGLVASGVGSSGLTEHFASTTCCPPASSVVRAG